MSTDIQDVTGQRRLTGRRRTARPALPATGRTAVAVDLGSHTARVWAARLGTITGRCDDTGTGGPLMHRGRVADVDGCVDMLTRLVRRYPEPVPAGGLVVACRPVLASAADQDVTRRVLDEVFAPSRVLFIDTVRAAAVGSGAAAGTLLVADAGAELTEVALLSDGHVIAARRTDVGLRDLGHGGSVDLISDIVAGHLQDLRGDAGAADLRAAARRGMLLVGDGALHPGLAAAVSGALRLRVHRAADPRNAAIHGAGLAAMSLLRHPAVR